MGEGSGERAEQNAGIRSFFLLSHSVNACGYIYLYSIYIFIYIYRKRERKLLDIHKMCPRRHSRSHESFVVYFLSFSFLSSLSVWSWQANNNKSRSFEHNSCLVMVLKRTMFVRMERVGVYYYTTRPFHTTNHWQTLNLPHLFDSMIRLGLIVWECSNKLVSHRIVSYRCFAWTSSHCACTWYTIVVYAYC